MSILIYTSITLYKLKPLQIKDVLLAFLLTEDVIVLYILNSFKSAKKMVCFW